MFHNSVNKDRFLSVATKLQEAGFGSLQTDLRFNIRCNVFLKRSPEEVWSMLERKENKDLCTPEEYALRFSLPLPSSMSRTVQENLVRAGLISESYLKANSQNSIPPTS